MSYMPENKWKEVICAIDMDEWKHSWHLKEKEDNRDKCREILMNKLQKRLDDLNKIKHALDILDDYI